MNIDVRVSRSSFFSHEGRTLRFTETAPEAHSEPGAVCGCTSAVAERPAGSPTQVQTSVRLVTEHEGRTYSVEVGPGRIRGFTVRWPWPKGLPWRGQGGAHAYFWPGNGLMIEMEGVPVDGCCNLAHTMLARMFFDDRADTSRFYNGHSPSRVVDPGSMRGAVWLHGCNWGEEAVSVLPEGAETSAWRRFDADLDLLFLREIEGSPAEIRETVRRDVRSDALARTVQWLHRVLSDPDTTALAHACRDVQRRRVQSRVLA